MTDIKAGDRVVWSDPGRKLIEGYHYRALPKDRTFIVEQVIEWPGSESCARLRGLPSPMPLSSIELAERS